MMVLVIQFAGRRPRLSPSYQRTRNGRSRAESMIPALTVSLTIRKLDSTTWPLNCKAIPQLQLTSLPMVVAPARWDKPIGCWPAPVIIWFHREALMPRASSSAMEDSVKRMRWRFGWCRAERRRQDHHPLFKRVMPGPARRRQAHRPDDAEAKSFEQGGTEKGGKSTNTLVSFFTFARMIRPPDALYYRYCLSQFRRH